MTVAAQTPSVSAVATGGQTVFPFAFRVDASGDIVVYVNGVAQGGGSYGVALNADQSGSPGGNVTFGVGRTVGDVVTVERQQARSQSLDLTTRARLPSSSIEAALDKVVMLIQEFWVMLSRALTISRDHASAIGSFDLPAPSLGAVIGWVSAGGGKFKLGNINGIMQSEALTDSGDHQHYTSAHAPVGAGALYKNGQRLVSPDDYSVAGNAWTFVNPNGAGDKIYADYSY